MDDRTLTALRESIAHWERNVAAETPEDVKIGTINCALCGLFHDVWDCRGCPVMARTGSSCCIGSPYVAIPRARWLWWNSEGSREDFRAAAQAELDFLKSLLPEAGKHP